MERLKVSGRSGLGLALALALAPLSGQAAGTETSTGTRNAASTETSTRSAGSRDDMKDLKEDLQKLSADNFAEVEAGKVAKQQASSEQVKSFAQQMIDDHGTAGAELAALARKKGIDLAGKDSTERAEDHLEDLTDLRKKSGADFDRAYMEQMEEDHEKVEKSLRELASETKDAELKAFFEKTRATVSGHLAHARSARTAMNKADRARQAAQARTADPARSGTGAADPAMSDAGASDPAASGLGSGLGAPPEPAPGPGTEAPEGSR